MFKSFFPNPKIFFYSAIAWFFIVLALWHGYAGSLGAHMAIVSAPEVVPGERPPFLTQDKAWVYVYILVSTLLFCVGWAFYGLSLIHI